MIPSLNGLRALSILIVLAGHAAICAGHKSWWVHGYTNSGVTIFFVVSGFLITTLMLREAEQTGMVNIRAFYIRRAWRILPVAYAYLLIITLAQHRQFPWQDIALSWTYLTSYAVCFHPNFPWALYHLWSLSVEEQFYLLWPLIFMYSPRLAAWAAVLIAPIFRYFCTKSGWDTAALFAFPAVVDSIATGCLIALYAKPLTRLVVNRRWLGCVWLVALACPALIGLANYTDFLWPLPQLLAHASSSIFNISVGLGIIWAVAWQPKVLNHWFPVWLGAISYSLYIWHMPFMNPQAGIAFPFNVILAFLAAAVSYYLLEQPVLELRNLRNNQPIKGQASIG